MKAYKLSKKQVEFLVNNYTLRRTFGVQYNDKETGNRGTRIVCFYINKETDMMGFNDEWIEILVNFRIRRFLNPDFDSTTFGKEWMGGNQDEGVYDAIFAMHPQSVSNHGGRINAYLTACLSREHTEEQRLKYAALQRLPPSERAFHIYDNRYDEYREILKEEENEQ